MNNLQPIGGPVPTFLLSAFTPSCPSSPFPFLSPPFSLPLPAPLKPDRGLAQHTPSCHHSIGTMPKLFPPCVPFPRLYLSFPFLSALPSIRSRPLKYS